MPYYLYRIAPDKKLTYCDQVFDGYRDAKLSARQIRSEQPESDKDTIKVIFAKNQDEAEDLLLTPGKPRPKGEDR